MKKAGIKIGRIEGGGKQVYVATLERADYHVLSEADGWIKVKTGRGVEGWFAGLRHGCVAKRDVAQSDLCIMHDRAARSACRQQ